MGGYTEIGQTHVFRGVGKTHHAPKVIVERKAELLFFVPTLDPVKTLAPSAAPVELYDNWGLEQFAKIVTARWSAGQRERSWPKGYPGDAMRLINTSLIPP